MRLEQQAPKNQYGEYDKKDDADNLVVAEPAYALGLGVVESLKIHQEANHGVHESCKVEKKSVKRLPPANEKYREYHEKTADRFKELRRVEPGRMHLLLIEPGSA